MSEAKLGTYTKTLSKPGTFLIISIISLILLRPGASKACTNVLITRGASKDGSTIITYAADSHDLYGELYFTPAATHPEGAMLEIKDWDSGTRLGEIKQVPKTYSVVGNMNEHQLAISETTFGGREELRNKEGGIDYGSLIYVTLQRAKTAREAVKVMTDLVQEYGYYSGGESFSISDTEEVWIMEMIGKGPGEKGAVWVACKIPDGYVSAHANQARIRQFPQDDENKCIFSDDVISFARKKGYFEGEDKDFSFTCAYAPANCRDLRVREARVWSVFRRVAPSMNFSPEYAQCKRGAEPYPLWIKPDRKLSVHDAMELMRDQFQDSPFDLTKDVGAGPFELPYRWRPLTWEFEGREYLHERAIATQQTAFSFVSQSRKGMPGPIGGVLWFSVDDTASTVFVPMYAGITEIPKSFAVGTGSLKEFTWKSAFWVFNWVANYAYSRYKDMIVDIRKVQGELESGFFEKQKEIEEKALALYKKSPAKARAFLTEYSKDSAAAVVKRWRKLGEDLLVKYLDGNVKDEDGKIHHPNYPEHWRRRIVEETGDHYRLPLKDVKLTDAQRAAQAPAETEDKDKKDEAEKAEKKPRDGCGCSFETQGGSPFYTLFLILVFAAGSFFVRKSTRKKSR